MNKEFRIVDTTSRGALPLDEKTGVEACVSASLRSWKIDRSTRPAIACAIALLSVFHQVHAQSNATPPQFQAASADVNSNLASFETSVNTVWDRSPYPVLRSSMLQSAISDLTTKLLSPNYYQMAVLSELNSLQALGINAVTIQINFPALYQPYYSNPADYQSYLAFYTQLTAEVRSRGLKLIVENSISVPYPGTNAAGFTTYYQSLDWPTYQQQRAQLAASIAQLIQPDYLVLLEEPDTEASVTGQTNVNTVAGGTQMLQGMIAAVQATGATGVQLTAGCGTWNPNFLQFVQSFATLPLQDIDMHIYPVNLNNLPNALAAVTLIRAAGKQPTMSEMWAFKESDEDYTANIPYTTVFARDVFSFWNSTDVSFLQTMADFTTYGHFAFTSPFWSHYFSAYLDYNTYQGLPDATLISDASNAAAQASLVGAFTPTALSYENMLIPSPDQTPPLVPAAPTLQGVSQIAATIAWTKTTDNIGVAAYNVYRNSVLAGTVNSPQVFSDSGLTPATAYKYTLAAFDAAGNLSPVSASLTVTTTSYPDKTPPSVPAGLMPVAVSDIQVHLVWSASSDNVGVAGYEIYRGTSASNIAPYGSSSVNSFTDSLITPSSTYYYQVDAYDAAGNHSARSVMVSATSLADTTPPTAPGNVLLTTVAGPSVTVNWSASTDDYRVSSYEVFRGSTASNLQLFGSFASTTLTFTDIRVTSGKTYYYTVAALDPAGNISAMQPAVSIVAFPDVTPPTVPAQLQASPVSETQIGLTWTASTDAVGVTGYEIYRGSSPGATTPIGTTSTVGFTDLTAAPGKTYYYQVDAYDASNNHSAKSAVASATTLPDTTPPSIPAGLTGAAVSGPAVTLSWSASTDNYRVGSYQVFRGTSSGNLTLYAQQAASLLSYSDTRVTSGKTYFYAVAAVDVAGNVSGWSAQVTVSMP